MDVNFERVGYTREHRMEIHRELIGRLRPAPGIASAAEEMIVPLSGSGWNEIV